MKVNPNIDELLCSFIDGELPLRQQTEVRRLAARDPEVGCRLRQLQNCKILVSAMPHAEAPGEMLEQIRGSLERRTLLEEPSAMRRVSPGAWHLLLRKALAAAAMIALLAVLGVVVYHIVAPVSDPGPAQPFAGPADEELPAPVPASTATVVADAGFAGRLDLRTDAFMQADAFIRTAVEDYGVVASVESNADGDARVYRLAGTREGIKRLVTALGSIWENFDTTTLHVEDPQVYAEAIAVESVTAKQAAEIVAQKDAKASWQRAEYYAVRNEMPGRNILALLRDDTGSVGELATIPKPTITGGDDPREKKLAPSEGDAQASLTIVLRSSK